MEVCGRLGPMRSGAVLVFLSGLVALSQFTNAGWTGYTGDTFTMQYDSLRVASGAVPYRDFFQFVGPGTLWLQGLVFALTGAKAMHAIYLMIITLAALGAALYGLSYQLTGRWLVSWFAPLFVLLGLAPRYPYPYHHWYAAPFAVLTVLLMAGWLRSGHVRWLAIAGGACAVTGLFVQTHTIALASAIVTYLLMGAVEGDRWHMLLSRLIAFGAGLAAIMVPTALYFAIAGGLQQYIYDTLIWPPLHYGCRRPNCVNNYPFLSDIDLWIFWGFERRTDSPYSTLIDSYPMVSRPVRFYSGFLVTLGAIAIPLLVALWSVQLLVERVLWLTRVQQQGPGDPIGTAREDLLLLSSLVVLAYVAMFLAGINLALLHLTWYMVIGYPVLTGFFFRRDSVVALGRSSYLWLPLAVLACAAGMWYVTGIQSGMATDMDSLVGGRQLVSYVREHTDNGDTIVEFPYGGATYFYGRPAAIGYTLVFPRDTVEFDKGNPMVFPRRGFHTAAQYREMADQIQQNRPKLIIFFPYYEPAYEAKYWDSFPPDLGDFVRHHYTREELQLDGLNYRVYIRRTY